MWPMGFLAKGVGAADAAVAADAAKAAAAADVAKAAEESPAAARATAAAAAKLVSDQKTEQAAGELLAAQAELTRTQNQVKVGDQVTRVVDASGQPQPAPLVAKCNAAYVDQAAAVAALAQTASDYVQQRVEVAEITKPATDEKVCPQTHQSRRKQISALAEQAARCGKAHSNPRVEDRGRRVLLGSKTMESG